MPTARRTLTIEQLRAHLRSCVFATRGSDRVGVEVELTPLAIVQGRADARAAGAGVDGIWASLAGTSGPKGPAWRGGALSREPGGQLEYSGPAARTPGGAARRAARAVRELRSLAGRSGFDFLAVGMHPWADDEEVGLRTASPRYLAMQQHFDAIGPAGRRMMRQTGSVQVNVDFGGPAERDERWELAHRLAPVLTAAFANSSVEAGRPSTFTSLRAAAWLALDPSRTGIPGRFLEAPDAGPVDHYLPFALSASVMFVVPPEGPFDVPSPPISFRTWMDEGGPWGYPDLADWERHLGTLFPEVRPKGFLEVRSIDAPGAAWLGVPILLVAQALREPGPRRRMLDVLRPYHEQLPALRQRAARLALADPTLRELADVLVRVVGPSLTESEALVIDAFADRYIREGRTPGDELRELVPGGGRLDPVEALRLEDERVAASGRRRLPARTAR